MGLIERDILPEERKERRVAVRYVDRRGGSSAGRVTETDCKGKALISSVSASHFWTSLRKSVPHKPAAGTELNSVQEVSSAEQNTPHGVA